MNTLKKDLPKYMLPIFMVWIVICNVSAIVIAIIQYSQNIESFGGMPGLLLGIVIGINVLSILLLLPLFKMETIKPFLVSALIWFFVVNMVYLLTGLYWLLIPGFVQLCADLWFHWELTRRQK